jgi:hypothetical protein
MQYNYEFLDHLNKPDMPLPSYMIAPSYWKVDEVAYLNKETIYF